MKGKTELTIGVAVGSSIQIAAGMIPILVCVAWAMGKELTLYFVSRLVERVKLTFRPTLRLLYSLFRCFSSTCSSRMVRAVYVKPWNTLTDYRQVQLPRGSYAYVSAH
jgi:hypothetical protein